MKKLILQLIVLFFIGLVNYNDLSAQMINVSNISNVLKLAESDSLQKIERLAALKFHKIINNYRVENKLDTIAWDDAIWLTCKNHNVWMGENSVLSHSEVSGTKFYTGTNPGDRYAFATSGKGTSQWSGENALYNFNKYGKTIEIIAGNIASSSFEQWKSSSGHNKNMLGKRHKVHGLAFYLNKDGRVYGTDLFASNIDQQINLVSNNMPQIIVVNAPNKTITRAAKHLKIDINKIKNELVNKLYVMDTLVENVNAKKNKALAKASIMHSEYMCSVKQLTHSELKVKNKYYGQTEEMRMMKATHGLYFFKRRKIKLTESIAMLEVDAAQIDIDKWAKDIQSQLNNEQEVRGNKLQIGYGVSLKRTKNNLKFYVTRVVSNKEV